MLGTPEAQAILAHHPIVDLHADTLMWARWLNYDLHAAHKPPLPRGAIGGHVDLPRMREGGMGAQFFGLVSLPLFDGLRGMARAVHEQIDALDQAILRDPKSLRLVKTADEIEACNRDGAIAALLGIEGAHTLEGNLNNVAAFARRGVRYIGLLHFASNEAGFPAYGRGRRDSTGLTAWGRALVERCEAEQVIVDLAHINRQGFLDACEMAKRPLIVSHTGVLGAFEHWRNIDDAQLRAVANKGGCVGVIFCPAFVGGDGLQPIVKHLKHIIDVVGEEGAAIGSDWDGFIIPTAELKDPTGLPLLVDALVQSGMSEKTIGKILRGNIMRVLSD